MSVMRSRVSAENTVITGSRIFDNNSTASYSIDLPNGGNATIQNNTIEQGPNTQNDNIIRYGEEGSLHAGTNVLIANNTIVNDHTRGVTAVGNATSTPLTFKDNQVYGITSAQIGGPVTDASTTTYLYPGRHWIPRRFRSSASPKARAS